MKDSNFKMSTGDEAGSAGGGWWTVPREYLETRVSATVVNIVLGYNNRAPTPIWARNSQEGIAGSSKSAPDASAEAANGRNQTATIAANVGR